MPGGMVAVGGVGGATGNLSWGCRHFFHPWDAGSLLNLASPPRAGAAAAMGGMAAGGGMPGGMGGAAGMQAGAMAAKDPAALRQVPTNVIFRIFSWIMLSC